MGMHTCTHMPVGVHTETCTCMHMPMGVHTHSHRHVHTLRWPVLLASGGVS